MKTKVLLLVLGILIGLAAALLMPRLGERLVPAGWRSAPTEGVVQEKRSEEGQLLLTLVTADGAVLATFTERVAEIDLLVAPGDTVGLSLDGYRPFVEDPEIARVVKASATGEIDPRPEVEPPVERVPDESLPGQDLHDKGRDEDLSGEALDGENLPDEDLPGEGPGGDAQPRDDG